MTGMTPVASGPRRWKIGDYAPPGLEGGCRLLAVLFWGLFLVTMLVVIAMVTVSAGSEFVAGLCSRHCGTNQRLNPAVREVLVWAQPALVVLGVIAWGLGRRPPRNVAVGLFAVLSSAQAVILVVSIYFLLRLIGI